MGYVAGWVSLFVGFSAPTAAAAYAAVLARADGFEPDPRWMGHFWIVLFSLCHGKGIGMGARIQNALVLLKLILLLGVMTWAWTKMEVPEMSQKEPVELSTFSVSLVWIYFSYCGWNAAVYIASEVRDPRRQLPFALVAGTLLVTFFYVALNALFLWGVPLDVLAGRENVARVAFDYLGEVLFGSMVSFVVLMALLSSISSMTMAGPRVYAKMASDGYLPLWFAKASAPGWACVWLQGGLAISMLWLPTFKQLLSYMGFTLGISASLSILGLTRHKIRYPETIRVTGWPWIPAFPFDRFMGDPLFHLEGTHPKHDGNADPVRWLGHLVGTKKESSYPLSLTSSTHGFFDIQQVSGIFFESGLSCWPVVRGSIRFFVTDMRGPLRCAEESSFQSPSEVPLE